MYGTRALCSVMLCRALSNVWLSARNPFYQREVLHAASYRTLVLRLDFWHTFIMCERSGTTFFCWGKTYCLPCLLEAGSHYAFVLKLDLLLALSCLSGPLPRFALQLDLLLASCCGSNQPLRYYAEARLVAGVLGGGGGHRTLMLKLDLFLSLSCRSSQLLHSGATAGFIALLILNERPATSLWCWSWACCSSCLAGAANHCIMVLKLDLLLSLSFGSCQPMHSSAEAGIVALLILREWPASALWYWGWTLLLSSSCGLLKSTCCYNELLSCGF